MSLTEIIVNISEKVETTVELSGGGKGDKGDKGDQGDPGPQGPGGGEFPSGIIVMWSGLLSAIPSGWLLCDGNYSTPDLRSKFVKGAAPGVDPGATGGAATHDHDNHADLVHAGATVGNHAALYHSGCAVASHGAQSHSGTAVGSHNSGYVESGTGALVLVSPGSHSVTQPNAHSALSHDVTQPTHHGQQSHVVNQASNHQISVHSSESNEPVYFSLAFIMKS
jgi:hypothetical protein